MANVRLLRQSIQDYQKDVDAANEGYQAAYSRYSNDYDAVKSQTEAYNAAVTAAANGGQPVWMPYNGGYNLFGGKGGNLEPLYVGLNGPHTLSPIDALPDKNADGPDTVLVRNGNSTTVYSRYGVGNKWINVSVLGSTSAPFITTPPPAPTAPPEPAPVKAPNITASNARELMNPGQNQAQLSMNSAKGILGKSELTGDQQPAMRGSAFADPADPQGLKERGVLARVMGGQL